MKKTLLLFILSLGISYLGLSQVNIAPGGSVYEPFAIGTAAAATLPTGWKADKNTTVRLVGTYSAAVTLTDNRGGNAMSTTAANGIYNYGAGDPTTSLERAVGGLSSGTASKSVNIYVQLHNNGTGSISSLDISYVVEKYRHGSNAAGFTIQMYFSTDGTAWTSAGDNFKSSFGQDADNTGYTIAPGDSAKVTNKNLGQSIAAGGDLYLAWNYSVTSGTTTSNAQALGIDNVSISASSTPVTSMPTFNPLPGTYYASQNIALSCTTPGSTIHYTMDGITEPTLTSPTYTTGSPIPLASGSGTTTIKAKAWATGYDPSSVSTGVYILPSVTDVSTIAALRAGSVGAQVYRLTGEAIVTYFRSLIGPVSYQAYVQDATAAILIYDAIPIINTYAIGNGVKNFTGRLQNYNNMLEFIPVSNPGAPFSTGNIITPEVKTLATITSADQAKLVQVLGTSFGTTGSFAGVTNYIISDAGGSGNFYTSFAEANYLGQPIPTVPINLVALVGQYIDAIQLTSRNLADMSPAAPTWTAGWPKAENATPTSFAAKVNINTTGTSYLVVLPNGASAPTAAQVKAGQDATGTAVAANLAGTITCTAGNTEYSLLMVGLTNSTTYNVWFVAEVPGQLQDSPVMKSVTTTTGATAPVITSPTVTSITANSADLGGDILADGGSAITERGTVWSTIPNPGIGDNKLAEGGTTIGIFSHLRTSITTGVTIYFKAYAKNLIGTSFTTESSFLTLVAEPTNHAQDFTAGTTTSTTIPLSWTDALASLGDVPATGYLIKGSAISFEAIGDPVDGVPETSLGLVQNVNQGVQSVVMAGLDPGVTYYFKIYPYNSIGGTSINYKTTPVVPTASATTLILLSEKFDYTVGEFVGGDYYAIPPTTYSNNWTTHSGIGNIPVEAGSLTYPGLAASAGGKIYVPGINSTSLPGTVSKDINRPITTSSSVAYYSALINVVDATQLSLTTTDYFMMFGQTAGTSLTVFAARLGILKVGTPATGYRLSIGNFSGGTGMPTYTQFAQDLSFGTTYLVVVKYDRGATPNVATLWVNPTELGGAEPAGSVSNNSGTGVFTNFASFAIRNGAGTPKAEYDEIRVGTTFAQVTPQGPLTKTLNLTYVFPEGLYAGPGTLNPSYDESGLKWPVGVADHITVELHNAATYATIESPPIDVALSETGTATVTIPGDKGGSYYLTIKHRNSIETTSALPVDFSGAVINYAFDTQAKAFGNNLGLMLDGYAVIFAGDENQDGLVDGTDLQDIGNLADYAGSGYLPQDINGDGLIDGTDLQSAGNNSDYAIGAVLP